MLFAPLTYAQIEKEVFQGHEVAAREVLIKFRSAPPGDPAAQALLEASIAAAKLLADVDFAVPAGSQGWLRWRSRSKTLATLLAELSIHPDVLHVEPNAIIRLLVQPNDTFFAQMWGLQNTGQTIGGVAGIPGADIGAPAAWDITQGSDTIVIGFLDTGIDYNHPDLAPNVWSAPAQYTVSLWGVPVTCAAGTHGFNHVNMTCDPLDDNDHGSHVSGTAGARGNNAQGVTGVSWNVKLIAAKIFNASGNGTSPEGVNSFAMDAISYLTQVKAIFGGKDGAADIRVLSNSWGVGLFSQALLDEINAANAADILFVAAAGNSGTNNDTSPLYPASYNAPNVVAVAATDNRDQLADFNNDGTPDSNFGATSVDLGAPGKLVVSTVRFTNDGSDLNDFAFFNGTSMAAPHVSGTAALTLSVCEFDTEFLKQNLLNNEVAISSLQGKAVTGGRVNANNSVRAANTACPATGWARVDGAIQQKEVCIYRACTITDTVWDSGTIRLTVNGYIKSVSYQNAWPSNTSAGLAAALRNAINADAAYPVRAYVSKVSLSAKQAGWSTCYTVSGSSSSNYGGYPSFRVYVSGANLYGCK
ncbi:MAG: S8 family serine peptidase [Acidobacteria bacterium]|nr:S8 family serine peptidase [Acidobacteriota bacterium]